MATPLSDPAFYAVDLNGGVLPTTVDHPDHDELQSAFFVFADIQRLERYVSLSGDSMSNYRVRSFEALEDVQSFVEQHPDFYDYVLVNPGLGQSSAVEPFEYLVDMARQLT